MAVDNYTQTQTQSSPFTAPLNTYGSSILLLTNPDNELYKMELTLRSMIETKDNKVRQIGEPLCNEQGVCSIIGQTQAIVNQVTVMSNLTKHDIPIMMDFLGDTLAKDLMMNRIGYDIKSPASRDKIYFASLATAFICMKRAWEEGDRRFWKGSQQELRTVVEGQQQKKGMLAGLWSRKN